MREEAPPLGFSPLTLLDIEKVQELQPDGWVDFNPYLHYYIQRPFCHPWKAELEGMIVGLGVHNYHADTAWLSHIIVHKGQRGKGIGGAITKWLVDGVDKAKYETTSLIATELGEPVYAKLGFQIQPEGAHLMYRGGTLASLGAESEYLRPFSDDMFAAILALDALASGESRRERLAEYLPSAICYYQGGLLEGYYLPNMVEGHIVARTERAGLALLALRLQTEEVAVVPKGNAAAIDFLQAHGYVQFRCLNRMSIGAPIAYKPQMIFQRVGGQVG